MGMYKSLVGIDQCSLYVNPTLMADIVKRNCMLFTLSFVLQTSKDMDPYYEGKPPIDESALLRSRNDSLNIPLQGVFEDSDTFQDMQKIDVKWSKAKTAEAGKSVASAPKQLPFEFRALEACIESACTCLEFEVCNVISFVHVPNCIHCIYSISNQVYIFSV